MNGFGYSGGRRFSPTERTINENFLTVLNNINKSHPLFGLLNSVRARVRRNDVRQLFGRVLGECFGIDFELYLARHAAHESAAFELAPTHFLPSLRRPF